MSELSPAPGALPQTSRPDGAAERPVGLVRGTRDWLPADCARLAALERQLLDEFVRAGYQPIRTPILEFTELHERKSGAGIVSKLFEVAGGDPTGICLRPELTVSIVRAFAEAAVCPPLPWRVCMSGPVFRHEPEPGAEQLKLREFTQVGVELIGAGGPAADAEVIGLAHRSLVQAGIADVTIRIGHVGLIVEILGETGLPQGASSAMAEMLSAAAADGGRIEALESALDRWSDWLKPSGEAEEIVPAVRQADDRGVDRLFRQLVPDVTGRRSGHEIIHRLRRKWDLGHSLEEILGRVRDQVHALGALRGPAREVLERLDRSLAAMAPRSVADLHELIRGLARQGVEPDRIELDLGFGRGIGFYSQMIFELVVTTGNGPIEVCGGGRYDGLAQVLGSDRDPRGVGFAFGLERLAEACAPCPSR
ncbi:MAG TPA: ATP phosphoribosyltransferase regulatory subunit [Isosphaeraceae bacterium]|nr:ATP phosphoribosyltransferase regulatory subunit [Isosphaeraceae bacterium]